MRIDAHQRPRHAARGGRHDDRLRLKRRADLAGGYLALCRVEPRHLDRQLLDRETRAAQFVGKPMAATIVAGAARPLAAETDIRSEEGRVGKEWVRQSRYGGAP